jgi:phenylpropionate dioxygenase-like ring-hydroxylating dioxygenase large terminal subunit
MVLTKEENELLTQTRRGTPAGEWMRRYWLPAALVEELPAGGPPVPVRLLGEDLVLYRDEQGRPGLLGIHCSHRGADLSYGRLEDGGLRCIYHGWLYDLNGRCLEMPGEPAGTTFHEKIQHSAYPCVERAGVIFAYMGPGEPPLLPDYHFLSVPDEQVFAIKLFNDANYLQGNEGNVDWLHTSFLHYTGQNGRPGVESTPGELNHRGAAPFMERIDGQLTSYGLRHCKIRQVESELSLSLGSFLMPAMFCFGGGRRSGYSVNWHVPIDDTQHWKYTWIFRADGPLDKEVTRRGRAEMFADYRPVRNKSNRYLQDRESMRAESYSGVGIINQPQDLCVLEGAGPIQDRTQEHLTSADSGIVVSRQMVMKAIQDVQEGRDPFGVLRNPDENRFPYIFAWGGDLPHDVNWKDHIANLEADLYGALPAAAGVR